MKTIQERRSCRRLSREGITDDQLFKILVFASQFELLTGTQIKNYLLVRDVSGIEAGCYLFRGDSRKLHQVRFRDLQGEAHSVCLGQNLARDAAAIVVQVASLEDAVKEYGERAYRYLHFDAGLISQRLNLAAVAQGLGATSIGGFFDDMANDMLGIAAEDAVLHITCLGVKPDQDEGQVSKIGY
jgi:SagB-type dehydrogenase family enzyme